MIRTEIPLSKKKVTLLTLGGLLFVLLGMAMIFLLSDFRWSLFNILFKAIGLLGVALGGVTVYTGLKKLRDNKPGLIIDGQGITDNSSGTSLGFVAWDQVKAIRIAEVMDIPILLIDLTNPEAFIQKANGLGRALLKTNFETYGTPLAIAGNTLKCDFEKLTATMQEAFEYYKNKI